MAPVNCSKVTYTLNTAQSNANLIRDIFFKSIETKLSDHLSIKSTNIVSKVITRNNNLSLPDGPEHWRKLFTPVHNNS